MKLVVSLCFIVLAAPLFAKAPSVNEIINRARATVGTETALEGVVTLTLISQINPAQDSVPPSAIVLTARKPNSQRLEVRMDDIVETTIVHGEKGCVIRSNLEKDELSQVRGLSPAEFERVKQSTNQLFSFYRPDFKNGEKVTYGGIGQRRGIRCHKLVYSYPTGAKTIRFFSIVDDTLVSTVIVKEKGKLEIVGVGSQVSEGVKFPLKNEYYVNGKKLHTMEFTMVQVNRTLRSGLFDVPEPVKR